MSSERPRAGLFVLLATFSARMRLDQPADEQERDQDFLDLVGAACEHAGNLANADLSETQALLRIAARYAEGEHWRGRMSPSEALSFLELVMMTAVTHGTDRASELLRDAPLPAT